MLVASDHDLDVAAPQLREPVLAVIALIAATAVEEATTLVAVEHADEVAIALPQFDNQGGERVVDLGLLPRLGVRVGLLRSADAAGGMHLSRRRSVARHALLD